MEQNRPIPLRIAYLVNLYPAGSHTFIRREILALERRGVHVERMSLRGWDAQLVDPQDRLEQSRTRYVLARGALGLAAALLFDLLRSPVRLMKAARLALHMAADSERPWPIHLAYLAEACVVRQWAAQAGVEHMHAHFATNPAEIVMLARALGGPSYSFTAHGSDIMDRPAQVGLPLTVERAAFVVAVCSFGRSQIFKWVPHALWDRVRVIRCGLDPGYGSDTPPATGQCRRLLCIGRLSKEKGQLLLIGAAKLLAEAKVDFEIVLAGDGPMRRELEALIAQLQLDRCIHITGWLDAAGIDQKLRHARALVVPSLSEGLPVVLMEAMAAGRPTVAPYLAGIPELVKDGRNGWLFPAGDISALAAAMQACLLAGDDELLRMADAARADVWRVHDIDAEVAKLEDLFRKSAAPANVAPLTRPPHGL